MASATATARGRKGCREVNIIAAGAAALHAAARREERQAHPEAAARPLGRRQARERAACPEAEGLAGARRGDRSAVAPAARVNLDRALAARSWFRSGRSTRLRGA